MPESGGADTGVRKMAAAQDSRAWPRPRPRGLHTCTVGQMVAAGCFKSAVTKAVHFELCFLSNSCFVFFN